MMAAEGEAASGTCVADENAAAALSSVNHVSGVTFSLLRYSIAGAGNELVKKPGLIEAFRNRIETNSSSVSTTSTNCGSGRRASPTDGGGVKAIIDCIPC